MLEIEADSPLNISPAQLGSEARSALAQWPWIPSVEDAHGLPRWLLIAISSREANCTNEPGDAAPRRTDPPNWPGKPNHAWSPWQIDMNSGGSPDLLTDPRRAADIAAGMLQGLIRVTGNLKCACAAYNEGLGNEEAAVAHGPAHDPDLFTTGHDYGADVLGRLAWLQANLKAPTAPSPQDEEDAMTIAKSPTDEARGWTRLVFEIATNDEPSPDQLTAIANVGVNSGFEALVTQVLDSPQGQKRRAARDAAQGG